jgi:branched-chain amino acid transport system substrate-binding protein
MKKYWLFLTVLSLLVLILPACGGGEEEQNPTPKLTITVTIAPTATATLGPNWQVKIGAILPWSGPMAMTGMLADPIISLVEKQVKDMGGILDGRDVKVVKYDSRGNIAEAIAGATKLLKEDKVSALVYGGASGADNIAVSDFAEANHILFVDYAGLPDLAEKKYTVTGMTTWDEPYVAEIKFTNDVLKPKTVAILAVDTTDGHEHLAGYRKGVESEGIKVVYEQYTPVNTSDFSPYLTKIKYTNPDMLLMFFQASEAYISIAKQIMELGGWGNIKVMCTSAAESAAKLTGANDWYIFVLWMPGMSNPGAVKFEQDFKAAYGRIPNSSQVYFYNPLWTAINAINLAGTDTDLEKIAQTARSGKLEWDTPIGRAHYAEDGSAGLYLSIAHVENGKLVLIRGPQ